MGNTKELKKYLLEKENAFLLDENNNGKTIMLSGAWGSGKTHFWQNEIEPEVSSKLKKDKACVYVSLYGKESIAEIKSSIYENAYKSIIGEDIFSKSTSLIGDVATIFGKGKNVEAFEKINKKSKDNKSKELLEDGSVICLDDFERKSKAIDLNDLFGLISHLALSLKCKMVIILNSDVFTGKEAEVFRNVKEKTVNKFFYFEPTIKELFESISKDKKYSELEEYKTDILKVIVETEELNARIYIQVLDNCLEWLKVKKNLDENIIRVLVLGTFNFVLNHMILDYQKILFKDERIINTNSTQTIGILEYEIIKFYSSIFKNYNRRKASNKIIYIESINKMSQGYFVRNLKLQTTKVNTDKNSIISEKNQEEHLKWINEKEFKLKALWKYGYRLYYVADVDKETYNEIAKFIKSGILI